MGQRGEHLGFERIAWRVLDELSNDFGIRRCPERHPFSLEVLPDRTEVFDDPVVNECDGIGLVQVGMSILASRGAVCGPPCVPNPTLRSRRSFCKRVCKGLYTSGNLRDDEAASVLQGHAGGVIPPIFQSPQSV